LLALAAAVALTLPAGAQQPGKGGTLTVVLGGTLSRLDPALAASGAEDVYVNLVFNGLTRIDRDMSVRPDLAESWTASADLKTWTFRLRDKVTFQNGRKLAAEDVVATITRVLDAKTGLGGRAVLDGVSRVELVDPRTVRFTLAAPYAAFAGIFADPRLRIVPRDRLAELATAPVGTGPFVMRHFFPGNRMELARNPAYYEPDLPRLDAVQLRMIPDAAARLAALESGAIDILWDLPYDAADRLRTSAAVRVDSMPSAAWDAVVLHNGMKPFSDVRVRQALAASIDKDALVEKVLSGQGAPTHSPIPPGHAYYDGKLGYPAPDLARARRLLAEAGYPNGIDIVMQVPQECERRMRLGMAVRDMARPAGFRITLERVKLASYPARVWGRQPIYVDGARPGPGVDEAVDPYFQSGGWWNSRMWHYGNARVDELLGLARGSTDEARRAELFRAYQAIMDQTVPGIIAYAAMQVNGVRRTVQNFHASPMGWLELKDVWVGKESK
jgi:peptide/nickel transport system substrate-binding protein